MVQSSIRVRVRAVMDELSQCLSALPGFLDRLGGSLHTSELNIAEALYFRAEEFLELLRVLSGRIEEFRRSCSSRDSLEFDRILEDLTYLSSRLYQHAEHYNDRIMELDDISSRQHNILSIGTRTGISTGAAGRPPFAVSKAQLEALIEMGFNYSTIAHMFGVSERTILRRRVEYELPVGIGQRYSNISDSDLDGVIRDIVQHMPHSGLTMMMGTLDSRGIRVQRQRVLDSMHRVDPLSQVVRRRVTTMRRQYSVPSPNSLWHIDGLHKLIRWKLVIHGGIDGYSRLITFLHCSDNNRADTVLQLFLAGVQENGVPSRVRSDQGLENLEVGRWMLENRGVERGSIITGSSVHNQRIERLWREVNRIVVRQYRTIFFYLENEGRLDPLNSMHLYCLHKVYIKRINNTLTEFRRQFNHHRIRTEHNMSPRQLFATGILASSDEAITSALDVDSILGRDPNFGVEESGPCSDPIEEGTVVVDPPMLSLSSSQIQLVENLVELPEHSEDYGISKYLELLELMSSWFVFGEM